VGALSDVDVDLDLATGALSDAARLLDMNNYLLTRIVNLGPMTGENADGERDAVSSQVPPCPLL